MRTVKDRIRHTILFELLGVILVIPIGSLLFNYPVTDFGFVSVMATIIATVWNFVYNFLFDLVMKYFLGHTMKNLWLRIVHAPLFELGLLFFLLPVISWYLQISLLAALVMDIFLMAFYIVYGFVFNWIYDLVFPIPEGSTST